MTILEHIKIGTAYEDLGTEFDSQIIESAQDALADVFDVGFIPFRLDNEVDIDELAYLDGEEASENDKQNALAYVKVYTVLQIEPNSGVQSYSQSNSIMQRKLSKLRKGVIAHDVTNGSNRNRY